MQLRCKPQDMDDVEPKRFDSRYCSISNSNRHSQQQHNQEKRNDLIWTRISQEQHSSNNNNNSLQHNTLPTRLHTLPHSSPQNTIMNATRFALPPLPQPRYSFADIPAAQYPDLQGSTIEHVTNREDFQRCMGEMLLVCKEAVRRRHRRHQQQPEQEHSPSKDDDSRHTNNKTNKKKKNASHHSNHHAPDGSKPLSLEYLADRLDVDEPLWGYLVRHEGRLQGFVTVTTFTNYERSFRWDSLHEAAFCGDDDHDDHDSSGRVVDSTGALARDLQATVRAGNVWEEGIVWPRLAEISLLGGLGCGRLLVELVLEDLQRLAATRQAQYDYVVLQATHNSIAFYEAQGFCRVGAITERIEPDDDDDEDTKRAPRRKNNKNNNKKKKTKANNNNKGKPSKGRPSPAKQSSQSDHDETPKTSKQQSQQDDNDDAPPHPLALPDHMVMSKVQHYQVTKAGEALATISKKFKVSVWDVVFLNHGHLPDLAPSSKLKRGTWLRIPHPDPESLRTTRHSVQSSPRRNSTTTTTTTTHQTQWHVCKENDTPRSIAKFYELDCTAVVHANKHRLQGLLAHSRLKQGTQVRISNLTAPDLAYVPYAHWSFPDDDHFERGEPSYMMARALFDHNKNKKRPSASSHRPIRQGLAVEIQPYTPPPDHLVWHVPHFVEQHGLVSSTTTTKPSSKLHPKSQNPEAVSSSDTPDSSLLVSSSAAALVPVPPSQSSVTTTAETTNTTAYDLFAQNFSSTQTALLQRAPTPAHATDMIQSAWRYLATSTKIAFCQQASRLRLEQPSTQSQPFSSSRSQAPTTTTTTALSLYTTPQPPMRTSSMPKTTCTTSRSQSLSSMETPENLFNMVVRVDASALNHDGNNTDDDTLVVDVNPRAHQYWYVVTFIPDLRWCHLAPMIPDGTFGPEKPKAQGRPKYRLVEEDLGQELDISSSFCIPCKARAMKRTLDADKEEWDILGPDLPLPQPRAAMTRRSSSTVSDTGSSLPASPTLMTTEAVSSTVATAGPMDATTSRPTRKRPRSSSSSLPLDKGALVATLLDVGVDVRLRLTGSLGLLDEHEEEEEDESCGSEPSESVAKKKPPRKQQQQGKRSTNNDDSKTVTHKTKDTASTNQKTSDSKSTRGSNTTTTTSHKQRPLSRQATKQQPEREPVVVLPPSEGGSSTSSTSTKALTTISSSLPQTAAKEYFLLVV